jgi:hypothetical protein
MNNTNSKIIDEILIEGFLIDILKYFNIKELESIRRVSKIFYQVIEKEESLLFDSIEIYDNLNPFWVSKIIKKNYVKKFNFSSCEDVNTIRQIIYSANEKQIESLKLPVSFFRSETDLNKYSGLKKLSISNMYFSESTQIDHLLMIRNISRLPCVKSLKLNNIKFLDATFLSNLENKFEKLDFIESVNFVAQDMINFLLKQKFTLKVLRLDGEVSDQSALSYIIKNLHNLTELFIAYCQNFNFEILNDVSLNLLNLRKITLRKLRIPNQACEQFFNMLKIDNLVKIDFYDCQAFNNECLLIISNKAKNLEYLGISWSVGVLNEGVINLFKKCIYLKYLYVQGCKNLSDSLFESFMDKNSSPNSLNTSLKLVDFSKCDMIEDSVLLKVMKIYPYLACINYYGMNLKYDD